MDEIIVPSDAEMAKIRKEIDVAQRRKEFQGLKNQLHEMTYEAVNRPTEFEGGMQVVDTEKLLKSKSKRKQFFDVLIGRLSAMLGFRPVIGHIISIIMVCAAIAYLINDVDLPLVVKYKHYIVQAMAFAVFVPILKSASRSILLPIMTVIFAAVVADCLGKGETLFMLNKQYFQLLGMAGVLGMCMSALSID